MNNSEFDPRFNQLIALLQEWGYDPSQVMAVHADADGIEVEVRGEHRLVRHTHIIPRMED